MTDSAGRDDEHLTVSDRFDRRFFLKGIGGVSLAGGALASSAAAGAEPDDEEPGPECPAESKNLGVQYGCPRHLDGGWIIVLNDNDTVVNVTATGPDGYEETIEIQAHDVGQFEPLDDGEYHLATDRDDFAFELSTVEIDCPPEDETDGEEPEEFEDLGVIHGCPRHLDGGRIIVSNDNDTVVTVMTTGPDGYEETIEIQAHDVGQFEPLDDGEYHLATDRDNIGLERTTVEIDCSSGPESKNLGVQYGCPPHLDGGRIIISNDNEAVVNVTATGPGGYEETIEIQMHDVGQFEPLDDGEYHLTTDRDDFVLERTAVEISCPTEAEFLDLRVDLECVDGSGLITVSNGNDETVNVTVTGPDGYDETKEVPAGGSTEFAGLPNGTYDLETSRDDAGLDRTTVAVDY